MQNENNTPRVDPHHPQKKGESGAINKLNDNEDENADDRCGCGSSHAPDSAPERKSYEGQQRETVNQADDEDPAPNPGKQPVTTNQGAETLSQNRPAQKSEFSHNPNKADSANAGQNQPGKEMNESEDETAPQNRRQSAGSREGDQQQNSPNQPRSRRQLGDPDDEVSAETRRKEDLAEEAEKSGAK